MNNRPLTFTRYETFTRTLERAGVKRAVSTVAWFFRGHRWYC